MEAFWMYLALGFEHITDLAGFDHMLFLAAMAAAWHPRNWKPIALMATAFTVGHSVSLALSVLNIVQINSGLVELLIPITIFITCLSNFWATQVKKNKFSIVFRYAVVTSFGLIHGLGFSNFLRAMLSSEDSLLQPLFAFNIGLELGQLLVLTIMLLIAWALVEKAKLDHRWWNFVMSTGVGVVSLWLITERL